jgi:S-DNA-T family DNA segregation ATPase FtsK/SpoIIIE
LLLVAGFILIVPGPLVSATRAMFRPRPRTPKPVAPATLARPTTVATPSRSVLSDDSVSRLAQTRLPFEAPASAPDKVPMLDSAEGKRGLFFSRKPKVEPTETPLAVPVEPEPVAFPGAEFATPMPGEEPAREPVLTVGGWQIPPVDVLDRPKETELDREEVDKRARLIEEALGSYGVEAKVVQINTGPTVTQFGVEPGWLRKFKRMVDDNGDERQEEVSRTRIRVDRITALSNDLALALAAPSIRIEAPIPGKSLVGIEVPNSAFGSVSLRSVIESTSFQKMQAKTKLAVALGKGAGGESVAGDLTKMPHLLIAGSTGSGKTVCLDSIICCLLMHNSPDDLRVLLVDPKRVELVAFGEIPHLASPVVVEADKAVKVLRWLNVEMDRRYREFAKAKARNIEAYNKDRTPGEAMPYLVLVVDELADLMMAAFDEVEHSLCRLAQLARATGIHLIVATQRPSVDVVTGLIKANFPTRISFAVTSQVDSRTILDTVGAEKLLGRGDMLYLPSEAGRPKRLQGTFLSDAEMERIVQFWAGQRRQEQAIVNLDEVEGPDGEGRRTPAADPMLEAARQLATEHKQISASFLQRRLRIGYPRAARIMEQLEMEGAMGPDRDEEKPPFEV